MGNFDLSRAMGIMSTSPNPLLDTMAVEFGVPKCALDFTKDMLAMLPSGPLGAMRNNILAGKQAAEQKFNEFLMENALDLGMVQYDTNSGRFIWVSSSSEKGVDSSMLGALNDLGGLGTILGYGTAAWAMGNALKDKFDQIKNCIGQFNAFEGLQKGTSYSADKLVNFTATVEGKEHDFTAPAILEANSQLYDDNKDTLEFIVGFVNRCDNSLDLIRELKQERLQDPESNPEPCFWGDTVYTREMWEKQKDSVLQLDESNIGKPLEEVVSGTTLCMLDSRAAPGDVWQNIINISGTLPPKSVKGQFLFSRTGIYYDSYGGGLDYEGCISNIVSAVYYDSEGEPLPGRGVPPNMLKWLHKYNPNIGGKGEVVSWNTFNKWATTVFDINNVREDPEMQRFYDEDHFLQVILDQRNREIYDVSSYINQLQIQGYTEDTALLSNQRQVLYSKIATHDSKIKRRKKQIEVHVMLAPNDSPAVAGNIPINDFEGLSEAKIAIERAAQEEILFNPGEVSGVVLPLCPTFIKSDVPQDEFGVNDLMLPPIGAGGIISSDPTVGGTSGTVLSLNSLISIKDLLAIYNFLDSDIVAPDDEDYFTINCITTSSSDMPAQLVASSTASMFPSGIGVPYFRGMCNFFSGTDGNPKAATQPFNYEYAHSAYRPYGYGRIESGFSEMDSLLYNTSGATFEYWLHVPDLGTANGEGWAADTSLSSLNRVVMGCENRGGEYTTSNTNGIAGPRYGMEDTVRGLQIGFSRDSRIVSGAAPSNNPGENNLENGLVFHMSPTQSINTSGISFMAASADQSYCVDGLTAPNGFYGITVDTSTTNSDGSSFNDCSTNFVHAAVTVDYGLDIVSIYLNGKLVKSQNVQQTFGINGPPKLPSQIDVSSFSYDKQYEGILPNTLPWTPNSLWDKDFWYWDGPKAFNQGMGVLMTPWIIGGGFTDGMHVIDLPEIHTTGSNEGMNFMGGQWGGKKSGLHGYIGSLKLYNRGISSTEALKNYEAQRGFFENLQL